MKTTTYICDKCKQSVSKDDLVSIEISYKLSQYTKARAEKDICKTCLDSLGLLKEADPKTQDEDIAKNNKTLESKLLDILEDLNVQFV
jgi:hypothetical protein